MDSKLEELKIFIVSTMKNSVKFYESVFENLDIEVLQCHEVDNNSKNVKVFPTELELYVYLDNELSKLSSKKDMTKIRVVGTGEKAVENVAFLREKYGIWGQKYNNALLFRNKKMMKDNLENYPGIYEQIENVASAAALFNKHKDSKLVVKPLSGMGSKNTFVINSLADYVTAIEENELTDILVEGFQKGDLCHTDGIIFEDGTIEGVASKYINDGLSYQQNKPVGSVLLGQDTKLFKELMRETRKKLKKFAADTPMVFHAEWFSRDNEVVLNEVGSRFAGGYIVEGINEVYGFDLMKLHLLSQVREIVKEEINVESDNDKSAGWIFIPQEENRSVKKFNEVRVPKGVNIVKEKHYKNVGEQRQLLRSIDYISSYAVVQSDYKKVEDMLMELCKMVGQSIEYEKEED